MKYAQGSLDQRLEGLAQLRILQSVPHAVEDGARGLPRSLRLRGLALRGLATRDRQVRLPELRGSLERLRDRQRPRERGLGVAPLPACRRDVPVKPPSPHQILAGVRARRDFEAAVGELARTIRVAPGEPELAERGEEMRRGPPL